MSYRNGSKWLGKALGVKRKKQVTVQREAYSCECLRWAAAVVLLWCCLFL
jgi:hypothetical protein